MFSSRVTGVGTLSLDMSPFTHGCDTTFNPVSLRPSAVTRRSHHISPYAFSTLVISLLFYWVEISKRTNFWFVNPLAWFPNIKDFQVILGNFLITHEAQVDCSWPMNWSIRDCRIMKWNSFFFVNLATLYWEVNLLFCFFTICQSFFTSVFWMFATIYLSLLKFLLL